MKRIWRSRLPAWLGLSLLGAVTAGVWVSAQEPKALAPGGSVNITVTQGSASAPPVSITLYERHGHVTPCKGKCDHTGGGLIDVQSPSSDTVIVTMSGAVIGTAEMKFDLEQCFEVSFDDPKVKKAKITVEGRVIGLLRGATKGCAEYSDACAHVSSGPVELVGLCVPPHNVCGCDSLSVNDHDGPKTGPIVPGKYTLHETFRLSANGCWLCKHPSAEFAPDPALDPLWISYWEPFHGVKKDQFGFQVTVKVAQDTDEPNGDKKDAEPLPVPKKEQQ
jgi:hypothetical protein